MDLIQIHFIRGLQKGWESGILTSITRRSILNRGQYLIDSFINDNLVLSTGLIM